MKMHLDWKAQSKGSASDGLWEIKNCLAARLYGNGGDQCKSEL